jgi:anti-sigma factor RsiW
MSDDCVLLQRYLDGDLTPLETEQLSARFAHEPELSRELGELRRVGRLLRLWADDVQQGASLVEPILRRVQLAERQRPRHATLGFALAAALVAALPFASLSRISGAPAPALGAFTLASGLGAAIERIEPGDTHAQVFVVGATSTPVVWLSDESGDDVDALIDQDPG